MPLIDHTYFVGPLNIPGTDKIHVCEVLDLYIERHEAALLQDVLGYGLYSAYKADATPQRFQDIVDGKEYTDLNGRLQKWAGLVQQGDIAPRSPIAAYVYFHFMRDNATLTTGVGEAAPNTDNAARVSPAFKLAQAWNAMAHEIQVLVDYLQANTLTYPEWDPARLWDVRRTYSPINAFGI